MPSTGYLLAALAVILIVTFALRALPFAFIAPVRSSALLAYLGVHMPLGIMLILTAYTLSPVTAAASSWGPMAAALALTVGLQVWRRSALLSIVAGTGTYMLLLETVA
ncbi:branched-chain amino acid transporter permease [Tomitella biformata]|uniref:branched-chain amino acid transporter permease n=1 Tax=Tomitella biformata TaxID=630403 RepID=UPI00046322BE|nr:AzlD domain-containing protein [Tomitella biformata]